MSSPNTLVTGGAGFIGSHLVDRLVQVGHNVRVIDDLSTGRMANLRGCESEIEFILGSINDEETLEAAVAGCHYVVHLAALGSVPRSVAAPVPTHEINATGTLRVLDAARRNSVRRAVFSSSSSVYGDDPTLPKVEDRLGTVLSPYAASKLHGEQYCSLFGNLYGLDVVRVRFFNVFGPRQRADHPYAAVIPRFADAARTGNELRVDGDGLQSRDFTYIENTVNGLIGLIDADGSAVAGRVFNLACGEATTLLELIASLEEIHGAPLSVVHRDGRVGDVRHSLADISELRLATGYAPTIRVPEGLKRTYAWFDSPET